MEIRRVQYSERSEALGRLVMGAGALNAAQQRRLDDYALQLGFNFDHLWAAFDEAHHVLAAALLVPRPGRTAMLFHSPVSRHDQVRRTTPVIDAACIHMTEDLATMAQALVNIGEELLQWMLQQSGFKQLAVLEYMQCAISPHTQPAVFADGVTLLPYTDDRRDLFVQALDASYVDTLDCPGLRGLRATDDVLTGHRATGTFDPSLWHVAMRGDEVLGIMLINLVADQPAAELVYLGVSAPARGQRLASSLMRHGLWLCAQRKLRHCNTAVDQINTPAVRLYRRAGFAVVSRKVAMIRPLAQHA